MWYKWVLIVLVLLAVPVGNASAVYVVNGSFETGGYSGWTQEGNIAWLMAYGTAPPGAGLWTAQIHNAGPGYLSQSVSTTVGGVYDVSFWVKGGGVYAPGFKFDWNGVEKLGWQFPWIPGQGGPGWTLHTVTDLVPDQA
jgi:hypothetical protein